MPVVICVKIAQRQASTLGSIQDTPGLPGHEASARSPAQNLGLVPEQAPTRGSL